MIRVVFGNGFQAVTAGTDADLAIISHPDGRLVSCIYCERARIYTKALRRNQPRVRDDDPDGAYYENMLDAFIGTAESGCRLFRWLGRSRSSRFSTL